MFLTQYAAFKDLLEVLLHVDRNTLHVHFGLVLFFGIALLYRSRHRFARALAWLVAIAVLNECFDLLRAHAQGHTLAWGESVGDIVNTVLWPAVWVLFGARIVACFRWRAAARMPGAGAPARLATPARHVTPSLENPRP
ncbi:MAG: hypothetical protein AB7P21_30655 [Lautropia sp.]